MWTSTLRPIENREIKRLREIEKNWEEGERLKDRNSKKDKTRANEIKRKEKRARENRDSETKLDKNKQKWQLMLSCGRNEEKV